MAAPFQLSGSLEEIPLPDIARLFQATRKTGRLALVSDDSTGALYFDRGEMVDCHATNMSGVDALKYVALFNRGTFEFIDGEAPTSQTLNALGTADLINMLETQMQEARMLQELVPAGSDVPRYLGGSIPAGLEVGAADLAVALKAAAGSFSVRHIAAELNLDPTMVRFTIARLRAAGLMEIVGTDDTAPLPKPPSQPLPALASANQPVLGSATTALPSQPRYWRGRKIE